MYDVNYAYYLIISNVEKKKNTVHSSFTENFGSLSLPQLHIENTICFIACIFLLLFVFSYLSYLVC